MIDHLSTYATDFERTRRFYDAVLAPLGSERCLDMVATWNPDWPTQRMCAWGPGGRPVFWLLEVREPCSPRHVAFSAGSRAAVQAFHREGIAHGGRDNGGPGPREHYAPTYYGAFLIDPDGNNVEAVTHGG